jgi:hypothetical protein
VLFTLELGVYYTGALEPNDCPHNS